MMSDEEALAAARSILRHQDRLEEEPFYLGVISLCYWIMDVAKRLPKPKRDRKEYMREYMRLKRSKERLAKHILTVDP